MKMGVYTVANKIYRSETDKMVGGVCGGLGEYFQIDSTIIRLLWVALVLVGGSGILLYLIAWIIIPARGIN
jgi:phage shock protein PspC (stress-responsive transcriptional regulator)